MVCDSTNVFVKGTSGSEADILPSMTALIGARKGRVAVGCFASNVARLETITRAAMANDRQVALVGRSLWRMTEAARENGYLTDLPEFIEEHDVGFFPKDKIVMICTGSQGEARAALARIAKGEHPHVHLEAGDAVIFSSRVIPGNEKSISLLQNNLIHSDVEVITDHDEMIHVSGHPARDELTEMYQWVRPQIAIPVHGEARHIREHADLARQCQVPQAVEAANGAIIRLAPGPAEIVARVTNGRLGLDGKVLVPMTSEVVKHRHRLGYNGVILVSLVMNWRGDLITDPQVTLEGLLEGDLETDAKEDIADAVADAVENLSAAKLENDGEIAEAARLAARRWFSKTHDKKPITRVHVIRV
jgi:ribonuclease J